MNRKHKKGFTIVELVVVIAVIAILAAVLIPTFINLINKAELTNDQVLIKNINTNIAIASDGRTKSKPTMYETLKDASEGGFNIENLTPRTNGSEIVWDSVNNQFVLIYKDKNNTTQYFTGTGLSVPTENYKMWKIYRTADELNTASDGYSKYLTGKTATGALTVAGVGVDVGENTGITEVNYSNTAGNNKTVVIRTNSAGTALEVDDKSTGTINHYGAAGELNIIECHTESYHENGTVAFAEIKEGHLVLESGSEINHIHINSNDDNNGFETVVITDNGAKELPTTITRDEVTVTAETLVVKVESNGITENVYVYAEGTLGSTEKTATQNANVSSTLGELVLDNGTESKALSEDVKEAEKTSLVEEAITQEVSAEMDEDDFSMYEARIGRKGYVSFRKALDEANSGDTVVLLKDTDLVTEYGITKSITIYGGGHTVRASTATGGYNSSREGRVFDISNVSDLNVALVNMNVQGEASGVRGISLYGTNNINLVLSDCSVTANYYAINVASANQNLHVTLKNNTFSTGWCAIQSWSPNAVFDILGGTLEGNNDKTYNADGWNNFSTVVLNSSATNNTWNFRNVTIKANATTGNKQTLLSNRTTGSILNFDNCTFVYNDNEITNLKNIILTCDLSKTPSSVKFDGVEVDFAELVDVYYTNGSAVYENGDITASNTSAAMNTFFENPFNGNWFADGEGIKLIKDVTLDSNVTLQMTSGSIYLIFNGHTVTGGKIVLQGTASVISEVGTMSNVFEGNVSVVQNEDGSYTYSLA